MPIEKRDFTQGKAKALFMGLKSKGAVFVASQAELLPQLDVPEEKLRTAEEYTARFLDHLKPDELAKETEIKEKDEKR
jgi:hypothetical protein